MHVKHAVDGLRPPHHGPLARPAASAHHAAARPLEAWNRFLESWKRVGGGGPGGWRAEPPPTGLPAGPRGLKLENGNVNAEALLATPSCGSHSSGAPVRPLVQPRSPTAASLLH